MPVNYFSYFSEVEEYFVRKRGKNLLVSPLDWALIEAWREQDIPLHIVLRGIDRSFENIRKLGKKSTPSTLSYCHGAVMEAFQEYRESRIGKRNESEEGQALDEQERSGILDMLENFNQSLRNLPESPELKGVVDRMGKLAGDFKEAEEWHPAELERELGAISDSLVLILKESMDEQVLRNLDKDIKSSLKLYKKRVSKEIYKQLYDKQTRQKVMDLFGLPEFSLMNLQE